MNRTLGMLLAPYGTRITIDLMSQLESLFCSFEVVVSIMLCWFLSPLFWGRFPGSLQFVEGAETIN